MKTHCVTCLLSLALSDLVAYYAAIDCIAVRISAVQLREQLPARQQDRWIAPIAQFRSFLQVCMLLLACILLLLDLQHECVIAIESTMQLQ
jgi:hypothetical protein